MSWQQVNFENFIQLQRGFDLTKARMHEGEVPVLGSNCIVGYHNEAKVEPPGVVTGRSGTLGLVQYTDLPYWPHNTALWVKNFKGNHPKYAYYKLQTLHLENYNGGVSVPTLNRNVLDTIPVSIPDHDIQTQIADILSAYDDLIENNRQRIALLEQAARLLYREWFVYLRFPGHEHVKIIDGVPKGWRKGIVSDLGQVITGKTPSTKNEANYDGEIPFVKTPDMHGQVIVVKTEQSLSERGANTQANKYIPKGSVMVSCIGTVGVVSITSCLCQTNQQINSVIFNNPILSYYSYFTLSDLKPWLEGIGGGATMNNVNKTKFSGLPIIIPANNILTIFYEAVKSNFSQIENLIHHSECLSRARDLLLPRLMNGEIAV